MSFINLVVIELVFYSMNKKGKILVFNINFKQKAVKKVAILLAALFAIVLSFNILIACSNKNNDNKLNADYVNANQVVFGGGIQIQISALGDNAQQVIDTVVALGHELNDSISTDETHTDSHLYAFNMWDGVDQLVGAYVNEDGKVFAKVDKHIYQMMTTVLDYYDDLQGYFNPAITKIARLWNVDIEGMKKYQYPSLSSPFQPNNLPTPTEIEELLFDRPLTELISTIQIDDEYYMSKGDADIELDLGGIAKGYLADLAKEVAKEQGLKSAMFNISGDIYFYGNKYFQSGKFEPFAVGITDPRDRVHPSSLGIGSRPTITGTQASDIGLVTSGDYVRFYLYEYDLNNGQRPDPDKSIFVQHIVNPKTGIPSGVESYVDVSDGMTKYKNNDFAVSSATAIHPSSMVAEMISTSIVAAGLQKGSEIVDKIIERDGDKVGVFALEDDAKTMVDGARYMTMGSFMFYNPNNNNAITRYSKYEQ